MNVSTQLEGEQISRAVVARAEAEEILVQTERAPNVFLVALNVACFAGSTAFVASRFGTLLEAFLGALAGAAFALAVVGYRNTVRVQRRLEAALHLVRRTAL